jgi:hypothetical protein
MADIVPPEHHLLRKTAGGIIQENWGYVGYRGHVAKVP